MSRHSSYTFLRSGLLDGAISNLNFLEVNTLEEKHTTNLSAVQAVAVTGFVVCCNEQKELVDTVDWSVDTGLEHSNRLASKI